MALLGALSLVLLISMVLVRVRILARRGVTAMHFGKTDKSDFVIPPFAFVYFYAVFAGAFGWPSFEHRMIFGSNLAGWIGLVCCVSGLVLMALSLASFGTSFRVLLGEFLIQPYPLLLLYLVGGVALFHRQVLREEAFLAQHYGEAYTQYRRRVPRYL